MGTRTTVSLTPRGRMLSLRAAPNMMAVSMDDSEPPQKRSPSLHSHILVISFAVPPTVTSKVVSSLREKAWAALRRGPAVLPVANT